MIEINKIYNEDNMDVIPRIPDEFIDLTVTSPPYDGLRRYNGYAFDFPATAKHLYRITKTGGIVIWIVADQTVNGSESGSSFRQALYFMKRGFRLHDTEIFKKINFIPMTHNRYEQAFEYMFVFAKGKPKTFNPIMEKSRTYGDAVNVAKKGNAVKEGAYRRRDELVSIKEFKQHTNIFEYTLGAERNGHPATFPEELAADHIRTWSNEGDLVFDPFMGSGTTAAVARKLNRNYIGCETSALYCAIAQKRLDGLGLFQ